jgi:transposase
MIHTALAHYRRRSSIEQKCCHPRTHATQSQTSEFTPHSPSPMQNWHPMSMHRYQLEDLRTNASQVWQDLLEVGTADANRRRGKKAMTPLIDSIRSGVPAGLDEIAQLGRSLWRRRDDILVFFDHHASNGPTEAPAGLEALLRNALGFRNLTVAGPFTLSRRSAVETFERTGPRGQNC